MAKKREMNEFWQHICHLLRQHLRYDRKPGTPSIDEVASRLGLRLVTVYKLLEGSGPIQLEDFPRFYEALGRPFEVLLCLVRECEPTCAIVRPQQSYRINGSMTDEVEGIVSGLGTFIDQKSAMLADGRLDRGEANALAASVAVMMDNLHGLLEEIGAMTDKTEAR